MRWGEKLYQPHTQQSTHKQTQQRQTNTKEKITRKITKGEGEEKEKRREEEERGETDPTAGERSTRSEARRRSTTQEEVD